MILFVVRMLYWFKSLFEDPIGLFSEVHPYC